MAPAGGDDGAGEGGGRPIPRGVDPSTAAAAAGQDLGAESGSRKRKAAVLSGDLGSLVGNGEHLTVVCEDSQRILKEIKDLRAQLDEDVKELGYCEANQKLRVELAVKVKEIQCLRKQNEEMQAKYDGMRKLNEELYDKNDGLVKQNEELQANNGGLVKQNEVLQTSNDGMKMVNGEPKAKNGGLTIQNELKANNDGLMQQNEELQSKHDGLVIHNEQLQAKNVSLAELQTISDVMMKQNRRLHAKNAGLMKWSAGLQAKIDDLMKQNKELQAKNDGLRKQTEMLQAKNVGLMVRIEEVHAENDGQRKRSEKLQAKNGSLTKGNKELQARNDSLTKRIEELQAKDDGLTKGNEELQAKINDSMRKWNKELQGLYKHIMKIMKILENEIDTKRKDLLQLEELYRTFFPIPQPEEVKSSVEVQSTSQGLNDGLTGCTDIGTKNSGDIILESVPCLKQAEAILCQAASNFEEIGHLQTQVTKSETAVDQLMAMDRKLVETKAALKKEIAAYAAYLERTQKKIEEAESEKASAKQLMATTQQVQDVSDIGFDDTEVDIRICDLMVTGRKSKSSFKKNKQHRSDTKTGGKVSS
ncbi:hypothetical protein SETIT_5G102000v2 [Setaria italica]|uniref:Uncharacterized protein n=1 Tax=Setaria italica TaxID=4555 RepID=A0A368R367_SETIT|nr:hypothetical protein SETIT_5G102000v2 [Setaria italica]